MSLELDPSQIDASSVPPSVRQVVTAGPGAGKTEVLAALLTSLLVDHAIDPTHGVLAISFSNAAVEVVDARLREQNLPRVRVQTIDSLARDTLEDLHDSEVTGLSFDARVQLARESIDLYGWDRLGDLEHLVVDEVQDVVGVRASFLLSLLRKLRPDAGFTLLGDSAQAIYDFQLHNDRSSESLPEADARTFIREAADLGDVRSVALTGQYRARTRDVAFAMALRDERSGEPSPELEGFISSSLCLDSPEQIAAHAKRWGGRTAFLCDTNGLALLVATDLAKAGWPISVQRGAQNRLPADWLGHALHGLSARTVSREDFRERLEAGGVELDPVELWRIARSVSGTRGADLDVSRLFDRLSQPFALPASLLHRTNVPLLASTIHRAKGLEFDAVALVESDRKVVSSGQERRRELFVAATRARDRFLRVRGVNDRWLRRLRPDDLDGGRWILGGHEHFMTLRFEVRSSDIEPYGHAEREGPSASVPSGTPLRARFDPTLSTLDRPVYQITGEGSAAWKTTEQFGKSLAHRIGSVRRSRGVWPDLTGLHAQGMASKVIHDTRGGRRLELVPIVEGLPRLDWQGARR